MPFPDYEASEGFESFFETTRIWLFGKPFPVLKYDREEMKEEFSNYNFPDPELKPNELPMPPRRIERLLRRGGKTPPIFARIYSFSFEGHYYNLPRPLIFLVYGSGEPIAPPRNRAASVSAAAMDRDEKARASRDAAAGAGGRGRGGRGRGGGSGNDDQTRRRGPIPPQQPDPFSGHVAFNTKFTGVDARSWYFSDDILVWAVDRRDLGICMDVEIANYQDLLLAPMQALSRGPGSRSDMISRSDMVSRSDMTSRSDVVGRGGSSFRSDMVGPHQNW
jgi:hypothetical protein